MVIGSVISHRVARFRFDRLAWIVLGLVLVAFVLRVVDLGARAMHHDESLHAFFSWSLAEGRGYRHDPLLHGPFQFHVISGFFTLFGDTETITRLPAALFGSALVLTPLLFRRWLGTVGIVATSFLLTISPSLLYFSRFARNEMFVAVWTVMLVCAVWRYRADGKRRWLVILAAGLSLSFATKETAYLTAALLLLYLSVTMAWQLGSFRCNASAAAVPHATSTAEHMTRNLPWLRSLLWKMALVPFVWSFAAIWPMFGRMRRRWGWPQRSREVDLMVVVGTLTASQLSAAIQIPMRSVEARLPTADDDVLRAVAVIVVILLTTAVGMAWNWRWWSISAITFYAIYLSLFSTGFTNLDGIGSGFWSSLDYWMAQQDVQRGNQPTFYYAMMLSIYELLTLVPALLGGIWLVWRRDWFAALLLWWFLCTFIALSLAGEKMPWLTVHLALPLAFLAGHVAGQLFPPIAARLAARPVRVAVWSGAGVALSFLAFVVAFTLQIGIALSFGHPDTPIEPHVYTQTSPDVPRLAKQIETIAFNRPSQGQRPIYIDTTQALTWPWAWYLRDLKVSYVSPEVLRTEHISEDAIVVAKLHTISESDPLRLNHQDGIHYRHRWWFPEQGYRQVTPAYFLSRIADGSLVRDWWSFFVTRIDESTLGSLDGEVLFPK